MSLSAPQGGFDTCPEFSIIIPTYARPGQLATCLRALSLLDYSRDRFEVIVVDDGSETPLDAVVVPFRDQLAVTLLRQPHVGPAAARNTGAAQARGEFLAFTDDDCVPASDWLRRLATRFALTPDRLIGGWTRNALPDNPYAVASQVIVDLVYAYYNAHPDHARFFASNNLALPVERFRALSGFDATFITSEDREFCDRWRYHGFPMTYAPEAVVFHAHALTLRTFCRQHFHYGRGAFRFHQARARRGSGRLRQELSFYAHLPRLLCRALARMPRGQAFVLATLLVVWQGANAAGCVWEGVKRTVQL
ncbi:MAG: glycosyltransferase [Deltaproteobacteria bacterium]|nr:glycosyltransferase [Deltaproteobacteria bacterium]